MFNLQQLAKSGLINVTAAADIKSTGLRPQRGLKR